jgi:DsbC/DsbD-like thiol-disulfide interchange protein
MSNIHRSFCAALIWCAIAVLTGTTARAADESPWNEDVRSAIRLIAGSSKADDVVLRAGIEVKLRPGWKTYWRYPGDSGVPPHFDFSGSENLKKADVLYPAPHLFTDETGQSLGYKDTVIFPVVVSPQQAGKPVRLRVKVDYAVCEKLCVPAEGRAELTLVTGDSKHNPALTTAEARVPKHVTAPQLASATQRTAEQNQRQPSTSAPAENWLLLLKAPPRNGLCPSRSQQNPRRLAEPNSASSLTVCRPASMPRAQPT